MLRIFCFLYFSIWHFSFSQVNLDTDATDFRKANSIFKNSDPKSGILRKEPKRIDPIHEVSVDQIWFSCDPAKIQVYTDSTRLTVFVNQIGNGCFGFWIKQLDLTKYHVCSVLGYLETQLNLDSILIKVAFEDNGRRRTDFENLKLNLTKNTGPKAKELILRNSKSDENEFNWSHVQAVIFKFETPDESDYWGNIVFKVLSFSAIGMEAK